MCTNTSSEMGCLKRVQEVIEQIKVLLTQDQMQHDTAD